MGRVNRRKNVRRIQREPWRKLQEMAYTEIKKGDKVWFQPEQQHPQELRQEHHQIIMKQGTDVGCNDMEESEFSRDEKATKAEV